MYTHKGTRHYDTLASAIGGLFAFQISYSISDTHSDACRSYWVRLRYLRNMAHSRTQRHYRALLLKQLNR